MSKFYALTVSKIERLTAKSVALCFEVPEDLKSEFNFSAGQYITLKTELNGTEIRRDYSLCASPQSRELKVAVKEVENGTFSSYANNELRVGDTLEVHPPNGKFVFTPNDSTTKHIALFAAGSGITPILSIVKCALEEETDSKIILVYGNKTSSDTMFLDDLLELQQTYSDRLSIQLVFSQRQENDAVFGRIEKSTVNLVLKNKYRDIDIDAYYLCGPEGMINTVKNVLLEHDVDADKIHFELFKASTPPPIENGTIAEGHSNLTVILDDESFTLNMSQTQTILEAALDEDIDVPYSCQGGICSSCIARITEGEATMRQNNILTDGEIAEGLVLTCQAHPTSNRITIDYDDV